MTKYKRTRDLMAAALNEAIDRNFLNLHQLARKTVEFEIMLFGKRTLVRLEHGVEGHPEMYLTVWWGVPEWIKSIRDNSSKKSCPPMDLCCSGYFELEKGFWIHGVGQNGLYDFCSSRTARIDLKKLPNVVPNGFKKEGINIF